MKEIQLNGIRGRQLMCRTKTVAGTFAVYMQPISESQEHELDTKERVYIRLDEDNGFTVSRDVIYAYGEVNPDAKEDSDIIKKLNLVDSDGSTIHSQFNYEKGIANYENVPKFYTTTDTNLWWKYCYTIVGKPKRIIVYKVKLY